MEQIAALSADWSEQEKEFTDFLSGLCAPPSDEPTEVFAENHVIVQDGPFAGSHWRLQFTPFAKFIFAGIRRSGVKRVTIMMSAQYVKTLVLLITFLRNAAEDPADTMWVLAEADHMSEFIEKRLIPYIEGCDAVAPTLVSKAKNLIRFTNFNLLLRGSSSRAKLQSDPIRRVICDERREWKPGSIDLLRTRMRTFPNAQEVSAGTPGKEGDELHTDYNDGSQTRAHFNCKFCGHSQPIRFGRDKTALWKAPRECGGFLWDTNDITKPDGRWNWVEVKKTVRYECENPACRHLYSNADKYELIRTMHPHDYNPTAPPDQLSFGGSAFEAIWESCDWDKLVEEFLRAVEAAKLGNIEPLKKFITETLGEPWMDQLGVIEDFGFLEARKQDYQFGEVWPEMLPNELFISGDRQEAGGEHYWGVIRAFGPFGKSRLVWCGRTTSEAELNQIADMHGVPETNRMIDSGFKATEVYKFCISAGWKAFKGDDAEFFIHRIFDPKTKHYRTVKRIWERTLVDPYMGTKLGRRTALPLFRFANNATKDLLLSYMKGLVGEWSIPETAPREYMRQMTAERREEVTDIHGRVRFIWKRKIRDNHYWDCELMIMVAVIIKKLVLGRPPGANG